MMGTDCLLDSASDLLTCASEMLLEYKRGVFICTEELPPPSIDSDSLMCPLPDEPIRPDLQMDDWTLYTQKRLDTLYTAELELIQVSGPSGSSSTGGGRGIGFTTRRSMPETEIIEESEATLSPPSHQAYTGSSEQTSTTHEVDKYGFLMLGGQFERLQPFVHYDPPCDRRALRQRAKWRTMMDNAEESWPDICRFQSKLLKKRIRKGIPQDWRYRIWPLLTGGRDLQQNNPDVYSRLLRSYCDCEDRIRLDLHRTLPTHVYFHDNDGPGQRSLFNCLKAYAVHDPEVGYVQGMGSLVAPLLLVMTEEDAFWTFAALMNEEAPRVRPKNAGPHVGCRRLFLEGLPLTHELISKLEHLLTIKLPDLLSWLERSGYSCSILTTQWWMTLFCYVLPFQHVLRVWDILFLEGWKMALRTGLAIMQRIRSMVDNEQEHIYFEAPDIAQSLPPADAFIQEALSLRITRALESWQMRQ